MTAIAAVVFVVLFFVDAGYGKFLNPKFGPTIPNRIGWVLMECPVFIAMTIVWLLSERTWEVMPLVFFAIFQTHYFQRSFIFPMLIRGNGRIPISIMLMGATFNTLNALMQGGWIFHFGAMVNPAMYDISWLWSWQFIVGTLMWAAGFFVNLQSDYIIRHLRKPGDTRHYIPRGGMFRYVSSANYFGDVVKHELGITAKEYIRNKIIEKAKSLLANPQLPINIVAAQLGFSYPNHFTRFFKNSEGISPSDFRQRL